MDNTKYFYRTAIFSRNNGQISLVDIYQPDNVTVMDKWMGTIVSLADGQHTVQELIDHMGKLYQNKPENLEKTILSVIDRLKTGDLIRLSKEPVTLPYYLASPAEELDLEKAKRLVQEDKEK